MTNLTYDFSLIQPYSSQLENSAAYKEPYIANFESDSTGKKLHFISADHENDINSPTFKLIHDAIKIYNPDYVIIESTKASEGESPEYLKELKAERGESPYAAHLGAANNIPFLGAEPDNKDVFAHMNERGYSAKDMMAYYVTHAVPYLRDVKKITPQRMEDSIIDSLQTRHSKYFDHIPLEERLSFNELSQWFEKNSSEEKSIFSVQINDFAPIDNNSNFLQKMSFDLDVVREPYIAKIIAKTCDKHDNILVVYGRAHLLKQQKMFEQAFGKVSYISSLTQDLPQKSELSDNVQAMINTGDKKTGLAK